MHVKLLLLIAKMPSPLSRFKLLLTTSRGSPCERGMPLCLLLSASALQQDYQHEEERVACTQRDQSPS
jgi:hypothetical protein